MQGETPPGVGFRPAGPDDFDYCAKLYFAAMDATIRELALDVDRHIAGFRSQWSVAEVRIIMRGGDDIGWLQTALESDALFLKQLFVDAPLRRRGIGTQVMHRLITEAAHASRAVTLGVVKTNPALRLYQRLGFATTHEDERKFFMRRAPDAGVARDAHDEIPTPRPG
jgi:ribosomal protein S18 acetylase RimI-like enzyme